MANSRAGTGIGGPGASRRAGVASCIMGVPVITRMSRTERPSACLRMPPRDPNP